MRLRIMIALLACLAVTGCGSRKETTTPKSPAKLKVLVSGGDQVIPAADRQGLFRDAGIEAQLSPGPGLDKGADAVARGDADLAVTSEPAVLEARDRGLRVVSIAALVNAPETFVVSSGNLRGPADLKGKKVATDGSPFQRAVVKTIEAHAGGPVQVVPASTKKPDARIETGVKPHGKKVHAVPVTRFGVPPYYGLVLVANHEALDRQRDVLRSFMGALGHAVRTGHLTGDYTPPAGKPYGWQDAGHWRPFAEWMSAKGVLKHDSNVAAAFTNEVLPGQGL